MNNNLISGFWQEEESELGRKRGFLVPKIKRNSRRDNSDVGEVFPLQHLAVKFLCLKLDQQKKTTQIEVWKK